MHLPPTPPNPPADPRAPKADPSLVYMFDGAALAMVHGNVVSSRVYLIHQNGDVWTREFVGQLALMNTEQVRTLLKNVYDEGRPIVAMEKAEFFQRLRERDAIRTANNECHAYHRN